MKRKIKIKLARIQKHTVKMTKKVTGMMVGALLIAISYNALVLPYGLLSGGVGGLSLIGNYLFGLPLYVGILILNIPLFIWGFKELDKKFMLYSLVGTAVIIAAIPLTKPYIPVPQIDIFLAVVFSGVVGGLGGGIFFKMGLRQEEQILYRR